MVGARYSRSHCSLFIAPIFRFISLSEHRVVIPVGAPETPAAQAAFFCQRASTLYDQKDRCENARVLTKNCQETFPKASQRLFGIPVDLVLTNVRIRCGIIVVLDGQQRIGTSCEQRVVASGPKKKCWSSSVFRQCWSALSQLNCRGPRFRASSTRKKRCLAGSNIARQLTPHGCMWS